MARIPAGLSRVTANTQVPERRKYYPSLVTDYLSLATYLAACGHGVELRAVGKGTILFCFFHSLALGDDVEAFFGNAALVDPAKYDEARSDLRKRMDEVRRGHQ